MITIAYPAGLNWFYARLALALERGLVARGRPAVARPAAMLVPGTASDTILVVSPAECAASVACARTFAAAVHGFRRRVLLNYDSIHSSWFARHLALREGLFTDVFDIGVAAQAGARHLGLPYRWIPEAAWLRPGGGAGRAWEPGRPLPWAVIGHAAGYRAALVSALVRAGMPGGFAYLPPLKPYGTGAGLDEARLAAILERTDLYIWNSAHTHPYHEGLRAIQAVAAGAAPAKIDPFHAGRFAHVPWVYPSLSALLAALDRAGPGGLHREARAFLDRFPPLCDSLVDALAV